MVSLTIYCFNPGFLANGPLITSDILTALFFLVSVGCLWRVFQRVTLFTTLASSLVLGGLFLSKMSAFLVLPMALLMALARLMVKRPLPVGLLRPQPVEKRWRQAAVFAAVFLTHALVVVVLVWASCSFRYGVAPASAAPPARMFPPWEEVLSDGGVVPAAVQFARSVC